MTKFAGVGIVCVGNGLGIREVDRGRIGQGSADEFTGSVSCGFVSRRRWAVSDDQRGEECSSGADGIDEMMGGLVYARGDPIVEAH